MKEQSQKDTTSIRLWSYVGIILGLLSFLSILDEPFRLIGLGCAAGALIIGNISRRGASGRRVRWSIAGIILAVAGAACCLIQLYAGGTRLPHTI